MGFWSKLTIFAPRPRAAREAAPPAPTPTPVATANHESPAEAPRFTHLDLPLRAAEPAHEDPIHIPRNRQELFEELQKNYREVVDLVRKVHTHLDREQHRAERMMVIAERFDQLMPRLAALPDSINNQAAELHHELVEAVRAAAATGNQHTDRIENALDRLRAHVAEGSSSQVELVHTMAAFREVMAGVAEESARTGRLLHDTHTTAGRREAEMVELMRSTRRTTVAALILAVAVAIGAMGVAVAAIVMAMK